MEKVGLWCKTISIVSVVSSLIMLVLPECKSKKTFRGLIAVIIMYVILNPFINVKPDFSFIYSYAENNNTSDFKESLENYEKYPLIITSERETEKYIDEILERCGVDGECKVSCDYAEEKIIIREVLIKGDFSDENKEIIEDEVGKICGEEILIIFSGAEYE